MSASATPCRAPPSTRSCADRKSTRLNSSHLVISYAVFCLKKKKERDEQRIARARAALAKKPDGLEMRVADGPYLCGELRVGEHAYGLLIPFTASMGGTEVD